jgi:hypothetical protein
MSSDRGAWASAFARQSRSDWEVYELLNERVVHVCHPLHYLQMACEKIGKAYRCRNTETELAQLFSRHVGFEKFLRMYLASPAVRALYKGKMAQLRVIRRNSLHLAREIEKLAPAVDRGSSPENAEYPWAAGDAILAPCDSSTPA